MLCWAISIASITACGDKTPPVARPEPTREPVACEPADAPLLCSALDEVNESEALRPPSVIGRVTPLYPGRWVRVPEAGDPPDLTIHDTELTVTRSAGKSSHFLARRQFVVDLLDFLEADGSFHDGVTVCLEAIGVEVQGPILDNPPSHVDADPGSAPPSP